MQAHRPEALGLCCDDQLCALARFWLLFHRQNTCSTANITRSFYGWYTFFRRNRSTARASKPAEPAHDDDASRLTRLVTRKRPPMMTLRTTGFLFNCRAVPNCCCNYCTLHVPCQSSNTMPVRRLSSAGRHRCSRPRLYRLAYLLFAST